MSWGINPNAKEKEKIFADFNDALNGMNCADGLAYRHYSEIFDLGRKLADKEYQQGRLDERAKLIEAIKSIDSHFFAIDGEFYLKARDILEVFEVN